MPKAIKKRIKKREISTETDVKDRLSEIKGTIQEKQKTVFTYSIITIAVVVVVTVILIYHFTSKAKSRELEYEAYKLYHSKNQTETVSSPEKYHQALDLFKQAYSKKKSPRVLLYIANSYYELGQYDETLSSLNDFIKKYSSEQGLLNLAYHKIAMIHLKKGNNQEAMKALDAISNSMSNIYKDLALVETARILEKDGKKEQALVKYKELTEKYPRSPFITEAQSKIVQDEPKEDPKEEQKEEDKEKN